MILIFLVGVFITLAPIFGHVMILEKCPMLKVAIQRAIEKLPHYDLAGNLFNVDHGIYKHQFVGFVSSYARFNVLMLFHLHSFVTFYTDSDSNTVVTCSLTTRHHILSNMQDCLIQLGVAYMTSFFGNTIYNLYIFHTCVSHIPYMTSCVFLHTWGLGGAQNFIFPLRFSI
jgi:hypothetical protein